MKHNNDRQQTGIEQMNYRTNDINSWSAANAVLAHKRAGTHRRHKRLILPDARAQGTDSELAELLFSGECL